MSGFIKRYNHTERRSDGMCACNCGRPARPNSAFASKTCANRVSKQYRKARELAGTATPDYTRRAPRHNELHHNEVEVYLPGVADSYFIRRDEYAAYRADYARMGARVVMEGQAK